jgi:hypothetical protein
MRALLAAFVREITGLVMLVKYVTKGRRSDKRVVKADTRMTLVAKMLTQAAGQAHADKVVRC